jgi:hypothetical protein
MAKSREHSIMRRGEIEVPAALVQVAGSSRWFKPLNQAAAS